MVKKFALFQADLTLIETLNVIPYAPPEVVPEHRAYSNL